MSAVVKHKTTHQRVLEDVQRIDFPLLEEYLTDAITWSGSEPQAPESIEIPRGDFALTTTDIEVHYPRFSATYRVSLNGVNQQTGDLVYSVEEIYR